MNSNSNTPGTPGGPPMVMPELPKAYTADELFTGMEKYHIWTKVVYTVDNEYHAFAAKVEFHANGTPDSLDYVFVGVTLIDAVSNCLYWLEQQPAPTVN